MPLVMKEDVTLYPVRAKVRVWNQFHEFLSRVNPIDVRLLGSNAVMLHPNDLAHLIEQFGHVRDFTTKSGFIPRIRG